MKLPMVLVHICEQFPLFVEHSLISVKQVVHFAVGKYFTCYVENMQLYTCKFNMDLCTNLNRHVHLFQLLITIIKTS